MHHKKLLPKELFDVVVAINSVLCTKMQKKMFYKQLHLVYIT